MTNGWASKEQVEADLNSQPHLFMRLAENALTVAESLRGNYLSNTAHFVADLRRAIKRVPPLVRVADVTGLTWADVRNEVVTFIDGGVGQVQISGRVPILLRVGSYAVRTGERRLTEREQFGYYPIILGDLEGGSKDRKDFVDIVRITAELLGGLSALERTPDLRVLMFHGPLVYLVGAYAGHTPFTEGDIDLFLNQYGLEPSSGRDLKAEFLSQARLEIYPRMVPDRSDDWSDRRVFEPLTWIAFLYRRLIACAHERSPRPIIAGVVERGELREFSESILLERVFRGLREKGYANYFNNLFGRADLTSPRALLERLGYTDSLLLGMLLQPGELSEPWSVQKYEGLRAGSVTLPGDSGQVPVRWQPLAPPSSFGFPSVSGCYVHISPTTAPIRVEVFPDLGDEQIVDAARRAFLYAQLLPGYGFPVGLNIADQFAHVPSWLTEAYGKLIKFHLSSSLQRGEITDSEMQRILVQAIYMTHRDWLFRPRD
jgi:hypothetical protein